MDFGIAGKVAVIAAGSRGCGLAVATSLAMEGVQVFLSGRQAEHVTSAVEAIRAAGGKAFGVVADMTTLEGVAKIVDGAKAELGEPTILIVNPPSASQKRAFEEYSDADFQEASDICLRADCGGKK